MENIIIGLAAGTGLAYLLIIPLKLNDIHNDLISLKEEIISLKKELSKKE